MAKPILKNIIEGTGFGDGGFGGLDEPFGGVGFDVELITPPEPTKDILFPPPRRGAVMLGGSVTGKEAAIILIESGVIKLGRTANVDTTGDTPKATRVLKFE